MVGVGGTSKCQRAAVPLLWAGTFLFPGEGTLVKYKKRVPGQVFT